MADSAPLITLVEWLTGEFDNQPQSLDQPAWFVHLRLWHRLLPLRLGGHPVIFAEQANALYLDRPYRQRVLVLQDMQPDRWQVYYLAFKQPERVKGAGVKPSLLNNLSLSDFDELPGCELSVSFSGNKFVATPQPDARCCFQYDGQTRQVVLGFEVSDRQFVSFDRGVDPDTGAALWGAIMGGYEFRKRQNFSVDLPPT